MALKITNTLTGQKEAFEPLEAGRVRMYVCGPTVYSEAHIGHAMSVIIFDVIRRYLEYAGHDVTFVQNFTDVDDKIIQRAAKLGIPPQELAERLIQDWLRETAALNIKPATIYPRATQEIEVIQEIIQGLIESSHAYVMDGDVFYRVLSFPGYGKLSKRQIDEMLAGARVEIDQRKEHPMDFVLWKAAKPGEPAWESPWGPGRPGWHIECSAMIIHHLGGAIDIHGGGSDLIFPHHENEIAQSEAYLAQAPWVRYWIHNGLLQLGDEKMSKSLGNLISIRELLERGGGEIFRFLVLSSHYRNPLTFTDESYESARRGLARLQGAVRGFQSEMVPAQPPEHLLAKAAENARQEFQRAMEDDFNTPVALAQLFDLAREINREEATGTAPETVAYAQAVLKELAGVLGLTLQELKHAHEAIELFVELLIAVRHDLRERKLWDLADQIRARLAEMGIALEDSAHGTTWRWI
jgi:cysteinyl-tRNA synthetase